MNPEYNSILQVLFVISVISVISVTSVTFIIFYYIYIHNQSGIVKTSVLIA